MANIANDLEKVNDIEVAQTKPTSEALFTKLGASINGLIDRPFGFEIKTTSSNWVCPANVYSILVIAVGGGGGGGEGGDSGGPGDPGSDGTSTTFNSLTVAGGGGGGERGEIDSSTLISRGYGGASGGQNSGTGSGSQGVAAPSPLRFGGTSYGRGGTGGTGGGINGGAGGAAGQVGYRLYSVTPTTSYAFVIGSAGAGGSGLTGGGTDGSAGGAGALAIFYMSE